MAQPRAAEEPKIVQIADGVWAQEEDRSVSLPRHLESHEGRQQPCRCVPLLQAMTGIVQRPAPLLGTRLDCRDEHDLVVWITGNYRSQTQDPLRVRLMRTHDAALQLSICRYCGMVEVRDVSLDLIVDEDGEGRRKFITPVETALRKDTVLGWYAGRRVSGRQFL